jgi:hypothetical protein
MCAAVDLFGIELRTSREGETTESTEDLDLFTKFKVTHIGSDAVVLNPEKSWASMRRILFAQSAYICREAGRVESAARSAYLMRFWCDVIYVWRVFLQVSCGFASIDC